MADTASMREEQKVAILLASLNDRVAASILQRLDPDIMARVADAIRNLGTIPGDVRREVITDCLRGIVDARSSVHGDEQTVNKLLSKAIGEKRAAALMQSSSANEHAAFSALKGVSAEQIASIMGREQPGVVALVLRYLDPLTAAQTLNLLPREMSREIFVIMCTGRPPSEAVVAQVEAYLSSRLGKSRKAERVAGNDMIEMVTNVLQQVDHTLSEDMLQAIDEKNAELGTELRDRLFSFEDIVRLNDVDMRRVLQEVDMAILSVALRNAPVDVKEKFFNNMSKRAAEGLKEDMEFSQKVKLSDVEAKQKEIINVIRELDGQGEISLSEGGGDEYV